MTARELAVAVQERITDVQSDLYHLKRVIERLQTREKADRRLLAVHLQGLIDDDPDALDDPWVQHWCINGGDKGLHKRVFRHIQWRQSSECSVDNPVGTAIKADG